MLRVGVLTISDTGARGERDDTSGQEIVDALSLVEGYVVKKELVPDERDEIAGKLSSWADGGEVDVVLTTGGTGLSQRDVTPEATTMVLDRIAPGFAEAMRARTFNLTPTAILSRGVAGVRGTCLIINLPGSPQAVRECLRVVLPVVPHAVAIIKGEVTEHPAPDNGRG